MRIKSLLIPSFIFVQCAMASSYYCTSDSGYVNYKNGITTSLGAIPSYTAQTNCETNCKTYKTCDVKTSTKTITPVTGAIKLSETDKVAFESLLQLEQISSILIVSNNTPGLYSFPTPISGANFTFPAMPTDIKNPIATKMVYSDGNNTISLKAVKEVTSYAATCTSGDILQGLLCYHLNNSYAIPASGNCNSGDYKTASSCEVRTYYPLMCSAGDTLSSSMCLHATGNQYYQVGATTNEVSLDMASSITYIDPMTDQTFNSSFYFSADVSYSGYTCNALKGQIRAGDYNNNFFSSKSTCETYCVIPNDCVSIDNNKTGCVITDTQYSNPVTDYTGKTVYTQVYQTNQCTNTQTQQTGCDAYKLTNSYNEVKYDTSNIGWRYSTYSGLEESATASLMTEQMQHIFSGWKGKCEYGMMWSNPFNDPMKILSYAIMTYSAAGSDMFKDTAIGAAHDSVQSTFNDMGNNIKSAFSSGSDTYMDGWASGATVSSTTTTSNLASQLTEYNTIWTGSLGGVDLTLRWTALIEAAVSLAYPTKSDYTSADNLLKSWMGSGSEDVGALAYVQCMASIGLSFPNLASWSAGDSNGISPELQAPYLNPLRLTDYQVSTLIAATSAIFIKATLMPISVNSDSMTYIALTPSVYYQVGQVICGGNLAVAENVLTTSATPPPSSSSSNAGMSAAKLAISVLPPPYNLIASLILDIVTSFESGNACADKEIAMKWGLDQFKTNEFVNFGQCHYINTECAAKWFFGSCMRQRNNYCCYDQIVTRVMMEGIKPQLGKDWSSCNDISINDLQNISFQVCKTGQDPYLDKCFPTASFTEFQTEIKRQASKGLSSQSMQDVIDQAVNSMAIPGKNLQETCKDCKK